ncbi:unnamed protein product [Durusdinium trenchii]|uniref:Pentatricopeptide repeat-containing protein n=1 Tax=Durusdinium trenchii TaxID=1381693 RepID=A0ABP0S0N6_9DINO
MLIWLERVSMSSGSSGNGCGYAKLLRETTRVITRCGRRKQWALALQVLLDLQRKTQAAKIDGESFESSPSGAPIIPSHKSHVSLSIISFNATISACERSSMWMWALHLLREIDAQRLQPDIASLNTCMSACSRAQRWQQTLDFFEGLGSKALRPSAVTFGTMVKALEHDWIRSLVALQEADRSPGRLVSLVTWNSAISACDKGQQWHIALVLLDEMKQTDIKADVVSYNTAMSACCRSHNWILGMELLDKMRWTRLEMDRVTLNIAVAACETATLWLVALRMLQEAGECFLSPDVFTYTSMIASCTKHRQWLRAVQVLETMHSQTVQPNAQTYNSIISACAQGSQWERALVHRQRMADNFEDPNIVTFSALINAFEEGQHWEKSLQVLQEIDCNQIDLNLIAANSILSALSIGVQWERALEVLREMPRRSLSLDTVSCNTILGGLQKQSRWVHAMKTFGLLRRVFSVQTDAISYNSVMTALQKGQELVGPAAIYINLQGQWHMATKSPDTALGGSKTDALRASNEHWKGELQHMLGKHGNKAGQQQLNSRLLIQLLTEDNNLPNRIDFDIAAVAIEYNTEGISLFRNFVELIKQTSILKTLKPN